MKNLVITGLGAVTPVGIGVDEYWQGIVDMKCGIEKITKFSDENVPITIAGEVKDFEPKNYMSPKLAKETGTFIQYAFASAKRSDRTERHRYRRRIGQSRHRDGYRAQRHFGDSRH